MDSRLYEQTVEPARRSSYTRAAEQLKPLAVHANWSLDVLRFPPASCLRRMFQQISARGPLEQA